MSEMMTNPQAGVHVRNDSCESNGCTPVPPPVTQLVETGEVYNAGLTAKREMPAKELGKHRYAALATFYLSPEQAEAGMLPGNQVMLDTSNIVMFGVVCVDCDTPYHQLRKTCPAPPSEWWS